MQIENYKIVSVGKSKDLTNKIFGDFKVLYRTEVPSTSHSKQAHWLCQCVKCKKYYIKPALTLTRGVNKCECNFDLTGQRFGRWTVISVCEQRASNKGKIYHCKCDCGNEKDVSADVLNKGESKSCGCLQKEMISQIGGKNKIDLTGQRFGKLVALQPIYSKEKDKHTKWICKCDCGNTVEVDMGNLRSGKSQSCGCVNSKQEEKLIKILVQLNIPFNYQYRFNDFQIKEFDFYINNHYIIEYDGSQHFKYTGSGWDIEEHFNRTRQSDLLKNKYCFDNNIPLIRIPYDVEYTIDDLKLETTRFLLTPENEQEYYNSRA